MYTHYMVCTLYRMWSTFLWLWCEIHAGFMFAWTTKYPSSKPFNCSHIKCNWDFLSHTVQNNDTTSTTSLFPRLSAYTCEPGNEARVLCVEKDLTWHIYTPGRLFPSRLYRLGVKWGQLLRLRDTVCSWRSAVHAHGQFSMDFELMPLVLSSIFFLNQK